MGVVPAGVHHADLLAAPRRRRLGCERQIDLLRHGQGVHVGAQRDDGTRLAARQYGHDAGVRHPFAHRVPEALQVGGDKSRRAEFAVSELRMLVDVAAPRDHARLDGAGLAVDALARRVVGGLDSRQSHERCEQAGDAGRPGSHWWLHRASAGTCGCLSYMSPGRV